MIAAKKENLCDNKGVILQKNTRRIDKGPELEMAKDGKNVKKHNMDKCALSLARTPLQLWQ